jgi:hypothetical protein
MPRGGKRPGAGRPKNSDLTYAFPDGFVQATKIMKKPVPEVPAGHRVPKEVSALARDAADYAFQRYIDVAAGRVRADRASSVLKAATEIRKEVCGPIAQKVAVDVNGRLELLLGESMREPKDVTPQLPGGVDAPHLTDGQ